MSSSQPTMVKADKRQPWMKITAPPPPTLERLMADLLHSATTPLASPPADHAPTTPGTPGTPGTSSFYQGGSSSGSALGLSTPTSPPALEGPDMFAFKQPPYSYKKCPMPACDSKILVRLNGVFVYKWITEHFSQRHHEQMHVVVNL